MLVENMNIGRYTKALNGAGNAASLSEDYRKLYDILEVNGMLHFGMTRAAARVERSDNVKEMQNITKKR